MSGWVRWAFATAFTGGILSTGFAVAGHGRVAGAVAGLSFCALVAAVALGMRLIIAEARRARSDTLTAVREGFKLARSDVSRLSEADKRAQQERERLANDLKKLDSDLRTQGSTSTSKLAQIDRRTTNIMRSTGRFESIVDRLPSEAANLVRFQSELVQGLVSMPALGGYAATAPTIIYLVESVLAAQRSPVVLECGSGTSTVWLAAAVRRRGDGRVVALEHDVAYAGQTRRDLARHGLENVASVADAPLIDCTTSTGTAPWYDVSALGDLSGVTLLFVDGPPGATAPHARRPAFELLVDRLADDAIVVLDDTHRDEEREIVDAWTAHAINGRRLEVVAQVSRSTVLRLING
jgi:protein-L-isoaspartate O-methyltransferase